jgi:hypothetical protein
MLRLLTREIKYSTLDPIALAAQSARSGVDSFLLQRQQHPPLTWSKAVHSGHSVGTANWGDPRCSRRRRNPGGISHTSAS